MRVQIENLNWKMKTILKNQLEILEIKNAILNMKIYVAMWSV